MTLAEGIHPVPDGAIAAVVTHLEMRKRAELRPAGATGWTLRRVAEPDVTWYRRLFIEVGSDWLWFSRLLLSDAELLAILQSPDVGLWTLTKDGVDGALLELNFAKDACELSFFGLAPSLIGRGAGRQLMNAAIEIAWSRPIERFHLKTCTLDSPAALPFYRRSGFEPVKQEVEVAPDPRRLGVLPRSAGRNCPVLG